MSAPLNEELLAAEMDGVQSALDEAKNATTCAREAHDADDYRTMSDDLWRAAAAAERQAAHYRGAAAYARLISEGKP